MRAMQAKNKQLVNNVNDRLIDLRNVIIRKEIPENENPDKIFDIVEKYLYLNKHKKRKGTKILTPKEMFQRLPVALAQVKAGNA